MRGLREICSRYLSGKRGCSSSILYSYQGSKIMIFHWLLCFGQLCCRGNDPCMLSMVLCFLLWLICKIWSICWYILQSEIIQQLCCGVLRWYVSPLELISSLVSAKYGVLRCRMYAQCNLLSIRDVTAGDGACLVIIISIKWRWQACTTPQCVF